MDDEFKEEKGVCCYCYTNPHSKNDLVIVRLYQELDHCELNKTKYVDCSS